MYVSSGVQRGRRSPRRRERQVGIGGRDRALVRRFQKIDVNEPSIDDAIEILKGLKPYYES